MSERGVIPNKVHLFTTVKHSHMTRWKRGDDPKMPSVIALANYLNVTLDEIVGRKPLAEQKS
jgi:hypothetical protein